MAQHPFRLRTLQRYQDSRDRAVLPRFVSPHTFGILWLLLALLTTATTTAWFARVPIYASGAVVVTEPSEDGEQPALVALLPADFLPQLRPGSTVFVALDGSDPRARLEVRAIEPDPQSPATVRRRLALDAEAARAVSGPVAVVTLGTVSPPLDVSLVRHAGAVYRAEVEIGSRRVLALVPVLGGLLGG
jgi:hypothetical protein